LALAKSAIDAAFRLQPDSGEAHLALGWHLYWGYFDYDHARAEVALAARTLPNNPIVFELTGLMDRRVMSNYLFERRGVVADFALIYVRLGERDLAIEQLNLVANKPNGPSYGWLRLSPFWGPLRGDPRFEKIVASLAPKDAK
jgi:hypothetical protein